MLAATALSALSAGYPAVMTPSKKDPRARLLLSPPVPRTIDPSFCIGEYPAGSAPEYQVVSGPDWEFEPLSVKVDTPSFLRRAVTKLLALPRSEGLTAPWKMPFSRSACTH